MIKSLINKFAALVRTPNVVDAKIPTINVINKSPALKDADLQLMVEACQIQLDQHVAPMWLRGAWKIVVNQPEATGGYPIVIMDNPDQAGALGYHTETPDGKIWGRVFVNPIIKGGGSMLHGSLAVSTVLSHEVIEAYCDPNVNLWADRGDDVLIAYEACDPVENDSYEVTTKSGAKVSVSNFVLPDWFDAQSSSTKFDFMAKLDKPYTMSKGGYLVTLNLKSQKIANIYGSLDAKDVHAARQDPHPASRSARKSSRSLKD